jgi:hypothetical protein
MSQRLGILAVVVSESGVVRVFHSGRIEATFIPELWLLDRHRAQLSLNAEAAADGHGPRQAIARRRRSRE